MKITIAWWKILLKEYFDHNVSNLKDGDYVLKKYVNSRSNSQNRYYRWLLTIIANELGYDSNEVHEILRMRFLYVPESSTMLPYCKSTSKLTTSEFSDYIEKIKNFAAEYGIILPDADQRDRNFNSD